LTVEESKRPSAGEALNHPWLNLTARKETWNPNDREDVIKNLTEFRAKSLMHKASLAHAGLHAVTKEERAKLDAIWKQLDSNNDGSLSKEELK
jgi:hypothetical protein